jgi:ATP-dependent RNA helicase RhlE
MNFEQFNFHPAIAKAVKDCGYTAPTAIQLQTIPQILEGKDVLGLAQTGTGKTAAFVLPTLQKLQHDQQKAIRSLILTPTRELAEQIHENILQMAKGTRLSSCTVYGGVSKQAQANRIKKGVDIVVACPGRLLDHINSRSINLANIEVLILDEADQMFDKGFLPDIRRILKHIPKQRQTMVFSATMPKEIRRFAEEVLTTPVTVQVDHDKPAATISHALFKVEQNRKTALLTTILKDRDMSTTLVFTRTKYKAKNLARHLQKSGYRATSLQGNLSQNQRKVAMDGFRTGKFNILVATDIAARGIDVSGISHVVNYDVPDTVEAYTHRTGRTGRAESTGEAFTFMTSADGNIIKVVERTLGQKIKREIIEDFDGGKPSASRPQQQKPSQTKGKQSYNKSKNNSAGWKKSSSQARKKNSSKRRRSTSFDFGLSTSAK